MRGWQNRKLHHNHLTSCYSGLNRPSKSPLPTSPAWVGGWAPQLSTPAWHRQQLSPSCPRAHHASEAVSSQMAPHPPTWDLAKTEPPLPFRDTCLQEQAVPWDGREAVGSPCTQSCCSPPLVAMEPAPSRCLAWVQHVPGSGQGNQPRSCSLLGSSILPATQSREKTPPSSTSVISDAGIGSPAWESHYGSEGNTLRAQHQHILLPKENGNPKE